MFNYWKNSYRTLQINYDRKCDELQNFKEAVYEKKVIQDLQNRLATSEKAVEVWQAKASVLQHCNDTLSKCFAKDKIN